ncbi:MAG: hypothetical protein KA275_00630 [Chitinophagaceae bacterium]|nr:hypothetical protein [Chitinophagaceae bacterium]
MKFFLLILSSFILYHPVFSQDVFKSENYTLQGKGISFQLIGSFNNENVQYVYHNSKHKILWQNDKLELTHETILEAIPADISKLKILKNNEVLFVFFQVEKNKMTHLFVQKINTNYEVSSPILLDSIAQDKSIENFEIVHSASENIFLTFSWSQQLANENAVLTAKAWDVNFNELNNLKQEFSTNEKFEIVNAGVSNQAHIFLILAEKKSTKGTVEAISFLTKLKNETLAIEQVNLKGYSWSGVQLAQNEIDNDLFFIGGFFHQNRYQAPEGIFMLAYNLKSKTFITENYSALSAQLSYKKDVLRDMHMRQMLLQEDGGITFISEKYYDVVQTIDRNAGMSMNMGMMSPIQTKMIKEYYYNDVMLFSFHADGKLKWSQTIVKNQFSSDDNGIFSSFGTLMHNYGNVIIFNDFNNRFSRNMAGFISSDGQMSIKELPDMPNAKTGEVIWQYAKQISNNSIIAPLLSGSSISFVKIKF